MVRLHGPRLHDVGIDGALCQEADALELAGLFLEHTDELGTDNLALLLRVGHAGKLVEETVGGVDIHQVGVHLVAEDAHHLLGLALAQQTMVDVNRHELLANGLNQQRCHYRRVNTAGKCQQHLLVTNLSPKLLNLFVNEFLCQSGRRDSLHRLWSHITCTHTVFCFKG